MGQTEKNEVIEYVKKFIDEITAPNNNFGSQIAETGYFQKIY